MFPKLVALFIGLPMIELIILIKLGEMIGFWPTVAIVIITGFIGASLARHQGFRAIARIQTEINAGRIPTFELIDGLLILIGGIVLLTPGILTDAFGFSMMVPWVRTQVKGFLYQKFKGMVARGETRVFITQNRIPPGDIG